MNEIEGEMSSAFEFKENELRELRNKVKVLEQRFEVQKQTNISTEDLLKTKEKEISDLKLVISRLEQCLNDDKVSNSKKIDTFLKEIGEKSQTIKNVTNKLKEMDKLKQDYEKNEKEILDLKNQIVQTKKSMKENELLRVKEQNRCIEELKLKSLEVSNLKEELKLSQCTLKENEIKCLGLRNKFDEINVKNTNLIESEEKYKLEIINYKKLNDELQQSIKLITNEKEMITETMKLKMEENKLEFDKLNQLHKNMLSQLNQEKLNKISEERSIESVIKDYNLLTEENAYLKKERQKMLQTFLDMLKKFKFAFENLKSYAKDQLAEWSLKFAEHIKQLNVEYSTQIKLYHNNLIETKQKFEAIQKAFIVVKSDCIQNLEHLKVEIIEKYNEDVMNKLHQNNEELEKRRVDFVKLQEEIDRKYSFKYFLIYIKIGLRGLKVC